MVCKRIFLFLLLGIFLISFTSALEWDNSLRYEKDDMKVTIENAWGLPFFGSDLGTLELKSHKSINEVLKVAPGRDKVVMYYDFDFSEVYKNGLGEVEFINMSDGESIEKDYHFVIWDTVIKERSNYSRSCIDVYNDTTKNISQVCEQTFEGIYYEEVEEWVNFDTKDIPKEKVRIGLATDVNIGETIDGIWTITGKEIDRHAVWTSSLNVGLVSYWKLDATAGSVFDEINNNNGTNNGATRGQPGIINKSFNFDGGSEYIQYSDDPTLNISDEISISIWINLTSTGSQMRVVDRQDGGNSGYSLLIGASGDPEFFIGDGVDFQGVSDANNLQTNIWSHVVAIWNGTHVKVYINGSQSGSSVLQSAPAEHSTSMRIATRSNSLGEFFPGNLDEIGIWNRTLTDAEITQLYNNGSGITHIDIPIVIDITLNSPKNNFGTQNQTIVFNTTIDATNLEVVSVSLLIDGVINETNSSGIIGDYIFQKNLSIDSHNWSIQVVDNETDTTNSATRDFFIVNISGVTSAVWTDEYQVRLIAGNLTESDFEINNVVITQEGSNLWKINTTEGDYEVARAQVIKTFFYGTDGSDPRINRTIGLLKIQTIDIGDVGRRGIYAQGTESSDTAHSYIGSFLNTASNNDCSSWSYLQHTGSDGRTSSWAIPDGTTRNTISGGPITSDEIGIDTSSDETSNPPDSDLNLQGRPGFGSVSTGRVILFCVGGVTWVDGGLTTTLDIDFLIDELVPITSPVPNITINSPENDLTEKLDNNITFNITSTISGSTLNEVKLFIDGILNETQSISGTQNTTIFNKSFSILGNYNWSVEVCDIDENCALSETRDFLILPFTVVNHTYDTSITEGESNTISVEIILDEVSSLTDSILSYNGTNFTTSIIFFDNNYIISSTITTPLVSEDTNVSFNFYLTVDSVVYQLQSIQQEILNLDFDICGGESNDTLLNMSLFDEETKTNITGTIEINANIISKSSSEIVATVNTTFEDVNYGAICFSPVSSFPLYFLDTEIRYFSDDYVTEFYHIQKADMADYPINLSLFNLKQNDSTEFSVTYKNNAFIFTEGAVIQLQRKYIGLDIYEVVEAPVTGDGGKAVLHIDLNTNKYRASVVKDGELLDFFENIVFNCDNELSGDCTHSLDGTVNPNNDIPIEDITDFTYSISIDEENQTVTVLFAVPSGTPSNINVLLNQIDTFGNLTSCNTTVITSAGSITCDYTDSIEANILELSISKNDVQLAILNFANNPSLDMDGINFFIMFLFMISLVGMAISSPEWMLIISVMVLMIGGTLLLVSGMNLVIGLGALAWLVVAIGIIIFKMAKQEDR